MKLTAAQEQAQAVLASDATHLMLAAVATVATSIAGTFYPIGLQAGDTGVRSVQSLTLSATWTSGTINLVAYRVLQAMTCIADGSPTSKDWFTGGGPRVYDGACLFFLFVPRTTTAPQLGGLYVETHG